MRDAYIAWCVASAATCIAFLKGATAVFDVKTKDSKKVPSVGGTEEMPFTVTPKSDAIRRLLTMRRGMIFGARGGRSQAKVFRELIDESAPITISGDLHPELFPISLRFLQGIVSQSPRPVELRRMKTVAYLLKCDVSEIVEELPRSSGPEPVGSSVIEVLGHGADSIVQSPLTVSEVSEQGDEVNWHQNFFGRKWLLKRVNQFTLQPASDQGHYLFLVGRQLYGKSAIAAELVRRLPNLAAFHFIKRGYGDWDDPKSILKSLAAQIRSRYKLPPPQFPHQREAPGDFYHLLRTATNTLKSDDTLLILIDGLDEAFSSRGKQAADDILQLCPAALPARCKIIALSNWGEHLNWLARHSHYEDINLDEQHDENVRDITAWIVAQNQLRNLRLPPLFIDWLVDATEGLFGVAAIFLRPGLSGSDIMENYRLWRRDKHVVPSDFAGILKLEWERLIAAAKKEHISEAECRRLLGFLALAKEPLTWPILRAAILSAIKWRSQPPFRRIPHVAKAIEVLGLESLLKNGERVLRISQPFLTSLQDKQKAPAYRIFHKSFADFILNYLRQYEEYEHCDLCLAQACADWHDPVLHSYAVAHRRHHKPDFSHKDREWMDADVFPYERIGWYPH